MARFKALSDEAQLTDRNDPTFFLPTARLSGHGCLGVTSTAACIRCVGWQDTGDALTGLAWGTAVARVHDKMPETIKALASVARNVTHVKLARSP